jgi:hypothetical protein
MRSIPPRKPLKGEMGPVSWPPTEGLILNRTITNCGVGPPVSCDPCVSEITPTPVRLATKHRGPLGMVLGSMALRQDSARARGGPSVGRCGANSRHAQKLPLRCTGFKQ